MHNRENRTETERKRNETKKCCRAKSRRDLTSWHSLRKLKAPNSSSQTHVSATFQNHRHVWPLELSPFANPADDKLKRPSGETLKERVKQKSGSLSENQQPVGCAMVKLAAACTFPAALEPRHWQMPKFDATRLQNLHIVSVDDLQRIETVSIRSVAVFNF